MVLRGKRLEHQLYSQKTTYSPSYQFLNQIQTWMHSPLYKKKLNHWFSEQLGFDRNNQNGYDPLLNHILDDLVDKNQSWDQLLLAAPTQKKAYQSTSNFNYNSFYRHIDNVVSNDLRVAGILSTSSFYHRYPNSLFNRNRSKAAAVYRIFLCDSMKQIVPSSESLTKSFEQILSLKEEKQLKEDIETLTQNKDPHGTQPGCVKCHYKIDPLANAFGWSVATLPPFPRPGKLLFHRDGQLIEIKGNSIRELARAITQTPEYESCQVKKFWKRFIGSNIPLDSKTEKEITRQFNASGRKINNFIQYLVLRPEFRQRKVKIKKTAIESKKNLQKILKRCDQCHIDDEVNVSAFSPLLENQNKEEVSLIFKTISSAIDLENRGENASMPPLKDTSLSPEDYEDFYLWKSQLEEK